MFFAAFTPDTRYKKVESAINKQIEIIRKNGISDKEMERVKNVTLTNRIFELFSAEYLCQRIGYSEIVDGDYKIWVRKLDDLENLNRDRLVETAEKYWKEEKKYTLYLKPKKINPVLYIVGLLRRIMPKR
jgi:predicted Zn-dependent peptidase